MNKNYLNNLMEIKNRLKFPGGNGNGLGETGGDGDSGGDGGDK